MTEHGAQFDFLLHFAEYLLDLDEPDGTIRSSVRQISFEFFYNVD